MKSVAVLYSGCSRSLQQHRSPLTLRFIHPFSKSIKLDSRLALYHRGNSIHIRCMSTKPNPEQNANPDRHLQAKEDFLPPTTITFGEKVKNTTKTTFWLGLVAIGCVSLYHVAKELMPTRTSPNSLFNAAHAALKDHEEVVARFGTPVKAYGSNFGGGEGRSREGRRYFVAHDEYKDDEGVSRVRIKFNIEGPKGVGRAYAEVRSEDPSQFEYLLIEQGSGQFREVIALIDNRKVLTREQIQEIVVNKLNKNDVVMYGHKFDRNTQNQLTEFGEFASRLRYVDCNDELNKDECKNANVEYFPSFRFPGEESLIPGCQDLETLRGFCRHLPK